MLDFFAHSSVLPYTVALGIMGGLFVLEMFAALVGFHPVDSFLPEFDMDFSDAGAEGAGLEMHGLGLGAILGWFHFGRVPALLILSLFLAGFGTVGVMLQLFSQRLMGSYQPFLISLPIAILSAIWLLVMVDWCCPKSCLVMKAMQFLGHNLLDKLLRLFMARQIITAKPKHD